MTTPHSASDRKAARYSAVAIILHWLIAALLIFEVGLGLRMEDAPGPLKFAVFQLHKSVGITILLLVAFRLLWRFYRKPPPVTAKPWERVLAYGVHGLFYLLLFALPISGWVIISTSRIVVPTLLYGVLPWPHLPGFENLAVGSKKAWHDAAEFLHENFVKLLYSLVALHAAGALKHHFIDRDPAIAKMAPGARAGSWTDPRLILILAGVLVAAGLGLRWLPIGATPTTHKTDPAAVAPVPAVHAPVVPAPTQPAANNAVVQKAPAPGKDEAKTGLSTWTIGKSSTIRFHTSWSGDAIDGGFARFEGDIVFSPDELDRSHVEIRVDTASIYSGDDQRDDTLRSPDWFHTSSFAASIFRADRFRQVGRDSYVASGTLRLKGISLPLTLPFTLRISGNSATMRGSTMIDRLTYKIGEGEFSTTDEIPAGVSVNVEVTATRK